MSPLSFDFLELGTSQIIHRFKSINSCFLLSELSTQYPHLEAINFNLRGTVTRDFYHLLVEIGVMLLHENFVVVLSESAQEEEILNRNKLPIAGVAEDRHR